MGNIAKIFLQDKDIRNLAPKETMYLRAVGNPKELYIKIYPSGMKTFVLKIENGKYLKIKEFRVGLYSVAEARKDSLELLKKLKWELVLKISLEVLKNISMAICLSFI